VKHSASSNQQDHWGVLRRFQPRLSELLQVVASMRQAPQDRLPSQLFDQASEKFEKAQYAE